MGFKIDWASLIVGRKFTVFALSYFVFEDNFQVKATQGAYIRRGDVTEGFSRHEFGRLIFGRGLCKEELFFGILRYDFTTTVTKSTQGVPLGIFCFTSSQTTETSLLPHDSSRPLFMQMELSFGILTVYVNCKYFPLYTQATRMRGQ